MNLKSDLRAEVEKEISDLEISISDSKNYLASAEKDLVIWKRDLKELEELDVNNAIYLVRVYNSPREVEAEKYAQTRYAGNLEGAVGLARKKLKRKNKKDALFQVLIRVGTRKYIIPENFWPEAKEL